MKHADRVTKVKAALDTLYTRKLVNTSRAHNLSSKQDYSGDEEGLIAAATDKVRAEMLAEDVAFCDKVIVGIIDIAVQ